MAEGSGVSAELNYSSIKRIRGVEEYIQQKTIPGATARNWTSYSHKIQFGDDINEAEAKLLLPDPQTNGGLLIAVEKKAMDEVKELFMANNLQEFLKPIGRCIEQKGKAIYVI